jgi:hypothetical protein
VGVFATYNGGESWFPFGTGFPSTMAIELEFYLPPVPEPGKMTLRCGTHGRSMWEVDVPDEVITQQEITAPIGGEVYITGDAKDINWYGFAPPVTVEYTLNDGKSWSNIADGATGNTVKWIIPEKPTHLARIRVRSNADNAQIRTSRTFTIIQKYTGLVLQNASVRHIPYGIAFDGKDGLWATAFDKDTAIAARLYRYNANTLVLEKSVKIQGGDSLYTDISFDRSNGDVYLHKITSTTAASGGTIYVLDTFGVVKRSFKSPATVYPIGLELVGNKLFAADRDGATKYIYSVDPQTGAQTGRFRNPFNVGSGPRCLCADPEGNLYQASTNFGGGSLSNAYALKMSSATPNVEISRFELTNGGSPINVRGIEYDPRDKNFWVSDYSGTIFKVAGLEISTGVEDGDKPAATNINIHPNPTGEFCYIAYTPLHNAASAVVSVVNMLGETVAVAYRGSARAEEQTIVRFDGVKSLPAGVYTVVVTLDSRQSSVEKLIISR